MNTVKIRNLQELRAKRAGIKAEYLMEEADIMASGKTYLAKLSPTRLFHTPLSDPLDLIKVNGKVDVAAKFMSFAIPLALNKTIFKKSGFLTRSIVAIASRKVGKKIGIKQIAEGWKKLKSMISKN